jgi:hypothetical protein
MTMLLRAAVGALMLLAALAGADKSRAAATETYNQFDPGFGYDAQLVASASNCASLCKLDFAAVAAPRRLVVTRLSCSLLGNPADLVIGTITNKAPNPTVPSYYLAPPKAGTAADGVDVYILNQELVQTYATGQIPEISFIGAGLGKINIESAVCSLFGYYT